MKGQMKTKDGDPVEYPIIRYVNVDIFGRIQHSIKGDEFWVGLEAHEVCWMNVSKLPITK